LKIWTCSSSNKCIPTKLQIKLDQIAADAANDTCYADIPDIPLKSLNPQAYVSLQKHRKLETWYLNCCL
jgi:hypothetical protein